MPKPGDDAPERHLQRHQPVDEQADDGGDDRARGAACGCSEPSMTAPVAGEEVAALARRKARGSSLMLQADQGVAQALGAVVDQHHGDDDQQQDGADVGEVEFADGLDQVLADAAGADEAHDRGAADIDLEAQQRIAGEVRQHLRHDGEADDLPPAGAGRGQPVDRLHVDVLDHFGEELAHGAGGVDGDGEHARQRAEAEGDDEDQREDDFRHGAAEFEIAPRREAQPAGAAEIGGGDEAEQEAADRAEQRADIGDQDGLPEQPEPALPAPVPFGDIGAEALPAQDRHGLEDVFREAPGVGDELAEIDLGADARPARSERRARRRRSASGGAWPPWPRRRPLHGRGWPGRCGRSRGS